MLYRVKQFNVQDTLNKHSASLGRNAEYLKTMSIIRLPGYITIQMVSYVVDVVIIYDKMDLFSKVSRKDVKRE